MFHFLMNKHSVIIFQFNFVGRVIGPRGMTLREVETTTGCKLLVRGKGSMKDKKLVSDCYLSQFYIGIVMTQPQISRWHKLVCRLF